MVRNVKDASKINKARRKKLNKLRQQEEQNIKSENLGLDKDLIKSVVKSIEDNDEIHVKKIVEGLSEYDLAVLIENLNINLRLKLITILGDKISPEVFPELNDVIQEQIIDNLDETQIVNIANKLDSDEVVELLEHMGDAEQQSIIKKLDPSIKYQVKSALAYPEDSAGRIMVREFVSMPDTWTVREAKKYLMSNEDLPEDFYTIFLIDSKFKPTGEITLDKLLRAKANQSLQDIMNAEIVPVGVYTDQEEIAHMFREYGWLSAVIVDNKGRLVGAINIDDVVHIIHEEATEDALHLSGAGEGDVYRPVLSIFRSRAMWLITNLFATIVASSVVDGFKDIIEQIALVAVLMPIVASMGGTTGNQTLAVVVRALATKELNSSNTWRMVGKEFMVGICNGALFAVLIGLVTYIRFPDYFILAVIIGIAMQLNLVIASLAGVLIPIVLNKLKADPAIASGVFLIAITDSVGFFIFLALTKAILF